ncbi:zinc finger CCCH domain-containing protein 11A-like [Periplaneta americana]|uniref:zinc finger CCCH domain-containing protein 11A-like n=1 Tax=Periplaneta americana TaxID=6978 RepID=UPI0037E95D49
MDTPRKNNDCYFYYYSTCLKGDGCMFRHEPSALGCETVCSFWQQGKCLNQHCNFRHMELRKNRKLIPCYWENQPGGCRKPHCSFQHKNPREPPTVADMEKAKECEGVGAGKPLERSDWPRRTVMAEGGQYEECVGSSDSDSGRVGPRRVSQSSETSYGSPPVDPLVVNFEEESDNESVPTSTPTKKQPQKKNVHVKTLEEIRLERIQAESAAFYAYNNTSAGEEPDTTTLTLGWDSTAENDLRTRILARKSYRNPDTNQDFRVMSLDEIRKNRFQEEGSHIFSDPTMCATMESCSKDVPFTWALKQINNRSDVENNNRTFNFGLQSKLNQPEPMEVETLDNTADTVTCNRKTAFGVNGNTLAKPLAQIQVKAKDERNRYRSSENLVQNSQSNIVIKTLAQIRAEKNAVVENTSNFDGPKIRSHSPIVFDCIPQKDGENKVVSNKEEDSSAEGSTTDESKKKKPIIIRKQTIGSTNSEEKQPPSPPKRSRRFVRRTSCQQSNETSSEGGSGLRTRQLKLKRNAGASVVTLDRSKVVRLTSDLLENSEVAVELPANNNNNVFSDLLQVNGIFRRNVDESVQVRLGQPCRDISGEDVTSSVSLTRSITSEENFNRNESSDSQVSTSGTCLNSRNTIHSSNLQSGESLKSEISIRNMDRFSNCKSEGSAVKKVSLSGEVDNTDEDLLLGSCQDNYINLDSEEDILQDIDSLLNDD